eukprot:1212638-Rhodomonas_salina.1
MAATTLSGSALVFSSDATLASSWLILLAPMMIPSPSCLRTHAHTQHLVRTRTHEHSPTTQLSLGQRVSQWARVRVGALGWRRVGADLELGVELHPDHRC